MRSRWWLAVQALVTILLLVLLLRSIDVAALRMLFARLPVSFYLLSLAVVLAGQVSYAWRWRLLLKAAGVSIPFATACTAVFRRHFRQQFSAFNGRRRHRQGRLPWPGAWVSDCDSLGCRRPAARCRAAGPARDYRALVQPHFGSALRRCQRRGGVDRRRFDTAAAADGFGTGGLAARVSRFGKPAVRLAERLQRLRLDMAAPLRRPVIVAQAALVVVAYTTAVTALYLRFFAVQQASVPPFVAMLAAVTATTVLSNIPISLNGLGLREQLHASLLAPLGIAPEPAVAISLLLYAHLIVASFVGLILWLMQPTPLGGETGRP